MMINVITRGSLYVWNLVYDSMLEFSCVFFYRYQIFDKSHQNYKNNKRYVGVEDWPQWVDNYEYKMKKELLWGLRFDLYELMSNCCLQFPDVDL